MTEPSADYIARNCLSECTDEPSACVWILAYDERCDFDQEFHAILGTFGSQESAEACLEKILAEWDPETLEEWMRKHGCGCGSISMARDQFGIYRQEIEP